jgi:ABC-type glycerol-3-phosphate transport system substrate-binding protein
MPGRRPMDLGTPLQGLAKVAAAFEDLFPDTKIEFTEAPVGQREYLVTQLAAEQAPEILNVNVEDVWQDVQKNWYVPLDSYLNEPNPFAAGNERWWDQFKYQAISRGKAAPDGKMYCITFDMVETGIFYNKGVFRRLGLQVPTNWLEFEKVQSAIKAAGITPFVADKGAIADWGTDLIFDQIYGGIMPAIDLAKDPIREPYMQGYLDWDEIAFLNGKGFFTRRDARFVEVFRTLKAWRKYFQKNMSSSDTFKMFLRQEGAMLWGGTWTVNQMVRDPDVAFDWGIFYLPPIPSSVNRFADGHQQVVIGGSGTQFEITNSAYNDTHQIETSEKLKRAVAFLQFLTVPANTALVVNEVLAYLPNIVGVDPRPELMPFHTILGRKYTSTKWLYTFDLRFNEIYRRMLDLYLNDGISEEEFMGWMETNVKTASDTVVRRKGIDLSKFEAAWRAAAPLRQRMKELPNP